MKKALEFFSEVKKFGQEDPRRLVHALKVGFALTLVSMLYYFKPLYVGFTASAMWAVTAVIIVFDFSVGATFGNGLNRIFATLLAGGLAIGVHQLADLSGKIGEPILLIFSVFLLAVICAFARFHPQISARYDNGLWTFFLTFFTMSASSFRDDNITEWVRQRLIADLIGCLACFIISMLVFPVWAGEDLHKLIASNLGLLGDFLEGFGDEYFRMAKDEEGKDDKTFLEGYKSVLQSQKEEDILANFARWEPSHDKFQLRHLWKQYLEIGELTRQCAYRIESLNGYLNADIPAKPEIRSKIQEICTKMSLESGNALKELASSMKRMGKPVSADIHIKNSKSSATSLNSLLKSGLWNDKMNLLEVVSVVTVASLLIDVVTCTEDIAQSVHELVETIEPSLSSRKPGTLEPESLKSTLDDANSSTVTIIIDEPSKSENGDSSATSPKKPETEQPGSLKSSIMVLIVRSLSSCRTKLKKWGFI